MFAKSFVALIALAGALSVNAAPTSLEERAAAVTTLTAAQVAAYMPYSYYAATAYCQPATTMAWTCGTNCNANSAFKPVASGGDGSSVQFWYVGYDSSLGTVIVGHQGTDTSHIEPILTDANAIFGTLDTSLFPGVGSTVMVHTGFRDAHKKSATSVLSAVQTAISRYGAKKVTVVGHSLGGAIAHLSSIYLPLHLGSGISYKLVTYGAPRVGNQAFVDYVNSHVADRSRIDNKRDLVPILPGRFLGYAHITGEKHIVDSGAWVDCPGQDSTDSQCTIGYVPNILAGQDGDHAGPYDGVRMGC